MKSGFAVIVGRSNVGKSTLLNNLIGTKLAITTPKPQTTRMPIRGVLHDPRGQVVFVDTPGVFTEKMNPLTARLNEIVQQSLEGVDIIVYVVDPTRAIGTEERRVLRMIESAKKPKILVINKIDEHEKPFLSEYEDMAAKFDGHVTVSALRKRNLKELVDKIFEHLSDGEPFYAEGQLTDIEQKVWVEELIREKVFLAMHDEIPYTVAVRVSEIDEREKGKEKILYIKAELLTTADRYKKILIGKGARQIKEIGQAARRELEGAMNKKIFLDLTVVVEPHWQSMV